MYKSLPPPYRQWVADQAGAMGLPDPDSYIVLLVRLEKQRQDLEPGGKREITEGGPASSPGRP
jgi:hypothetical protein